MAGYFDEHDCEPLPDGQGPNHSLHLARFLVMGGYIDEFNSMFRSYQHPPPASKEFIKNLETFKVSKILKDQQCQICLSEYDDFDVIKLPCSHLFHKDCITVWLEKTSTCPLCRHELPTDDEDYEEIKKQEARESQRKSRVETLHDSMFG